LYALLAGRPPFQGNSLQVMMAHQVEKPPAISTTTRNMPSEVNQLIDRMMAKKPEERYQSCFEVIEVIETILKNSDPKRAPQSKTITRKPLPPIHITTPSIRKTASRARLEVIVEPELPKKSGSSRLQLSVGILAGITTLVALILVFYFLLM
ncbi:MAG TPA: hypothetical protein PKA06_14670, partial [Gemmatales bacterium]|nr:hypothetical protein [Gemmatales bacterium]